MGNIIKNWITKTLLSEGIERKIVVYAGRFQPFHSGHYATYKHLVGKFGKDSVYIGTSNKTDSLKSPFKFNDKKEIMVKMFNIPASKIIQTKRPHAPKEIMGKFPEDTTAFITVVGEKDKNRLKGKYFDTYHPDKVKQGYRDKGYVYVATTGGTQSGTEVRRELSTGSESKRKAFFKKVYGKFDPKIFKLVSGRLYKIESVMEQFLQSFDIQSLIKEASVYGADMGEPETSYLDADELRKLNSVKPEPWFDRGGYTQMEFPKADSIYSKDSEGTSDEASFTTVKKVKPNKALKEPKETKDYKTIEVDNKTYDVNDNELQDKLKEGTANSLSGKSMVDDGPGSFYGNFKTYKKVNDEVASRLGFQVIDYIMGDDSMESFDTEYPNGAGRYPVSFFPSGIDGEGSARYGAIKGKEMKETPAFKKWSKHIKKVASVVGYKLIDFLDAEESTEKSTISEGVSLKELGITNFKSLFKKMPSDLQRRVYNLKKSKQRTDKHPEGNVLKHTIVVVNRSIKDDDIDIAIAAMFHDIGKDETVGIHPKKGHITHYGHEQVSASLAKKHRDWIESVGGNTTNVYYIIKNHMRYKELSSMRPYKQMKLKSFRAFDKLGKFSKHDRGGLDEAKELLRIPSDIIKLHKLFKKAGKKLYVVGGAVRDAILGATPKDFDLATDAKPDEVLAIATKHGINTAEVGKSFGVVIVGGHEIATFRKDIGKGRRPTSVDYTDIEGDVRRRDLTVNALFYDIDKKQIVDLVGGIEDLKKRKIKTVGKAEERFDEDPLRKLRALRFQAKLGGTFDKDLIAALRKDSTLKGVSQNRIRDEFIKSLKTAKNTSQYMQMIDKLGFTNLILPNLKLHKPYIKDNDYILFLACALRKNSGKYLLNTLSSLKYTRDEANSIAYLVELQRFTPDKIVSYKKSRKTTKLSDEQIIKFGKLIGMDMKKFVKFKLSVSGRDVPSDLKKSDIGLWIKNKEKEKYLGESLINEGGAYGHMSHPFDVDMNLTFGDLKQIISGALTGKLELTREKTDGQALAISWRDDKGLIAARNKGHLKNSGEGALDISGVASKFQGRGGLTDAYNFAMKDLTSAIKSLSKAQRDKIFQQGSSFMNLEVIYPSSVNVIPYGQPLLVFHGTMQYDVDGKAIGETQGAARILAGMIKQINQNVQSNYTIQGPPVVQLPKSKELSSLQSKFSSKVSKLQGEYGLSDTDGVADYHQAWWESWVDKNTPSTLDNKTKMGLVKRWAFMDKSFRLDKKNISDVTVLDWAKKTDKQDQKKLSKDNLRKFEDIFLGVGAEVLSFMSSVLTVNPDSALRDMKKRLDQTVKDVKKSGDVKKIQKLKMELERLVSAGGKQKIVPNEGIVFVYKGNTYKLTGTFAPLNQILGLMYF